MLLSLKLMIKSGALRTCGDHPSRIRSFCLAFSLICALFLIGGSAQAQVCTAPVPLPNGNVPASGGSFLVGVSPSFGCEIRVVNDPNTPWITVPDSRYFVVGNNTTFEILVAPNTFPVSRTGSVRFQTRAGDSLTLQVATQDAGSGCSFSSSPTSFPNLTSRSQTVTVNITASCTPVNAYVSFGNSRTWITLQGNGVRGSYGSGPLNIQIAQNLGSSPRTGTVVIAGQTITITQSCNIALTPTSGNFAASGGNGSFTIRTDCPWSISSVPSWVTVTSGSSGPGNATVTFSVASNIGAARSGNIVVSGATYTVSQSRFIGNAATPGVYANGVAYLRNSNSAGFTDLAFAYGTTGDVPISGDWNGDGVDTLGIYRAGVFYLRNSNSTGPADIQFAFGISGDIPIAGDWDGDGIDTIGLVRGSTIFLRNSNSFGSPDLTFTYGSPNDLYVAGDWNGDGIDSIGVFRPSDGNFYLRNSNSFGTADTSFFFGQLGDKPIAGDWNADGVDTIGVFRGNQWLLRNSNTTGVADIAFVYGSASDTPIVGDWNGLP